MPLFGFQTGSGEVAPGGDIVEGSVYTLSQRGTMFSMGLRLRTLSLSAFRLGIWNVSGGLPTYLLGATGEITVTNGTQQNVEVGLQFPFALNPGDYFLGAWTKDGASRLQTTAAAGTSASAGAIYSASVNTNILKLVSPSAGTNKDAIWANYWLDDTLPKHNIRRSRKTSW